MALAVVKAGRDEEGEERVKEEEGVRQGDGAPEAGADQEAAGDFNKGAGGWGEEELEAGPGGGGGLLAGGLEVVFSEELEGAAVDFYGERVGGREEMRAGGGGEHPGVAELDGGGDLGEEMEGAGAEEGVVELLLGEGVEEGGDVGEGFEVGEGLVEGVDAGVEELVQQREGLEGDVEEGDGDGGAQEEGVGGVIRVVEEAPVKVELEVMVEAFKGEVFPGAGVGGEAAGGQGGVGGEAGVAEGFDEGGGGRGAG